MRFSSRSILKPGLISRKLSFCRALFFPKEGAVESPLDSFMESVEQIVVDKGWFGFSVGWGDNIVTFFESGVTRGVYHPDNQEHL